MEGVMRFPKENYLFCVAPHYVKYNALHKLFLFSCVVNDDVSMTSQL